MQNYTSKTVVTGDIVNCEIYQITDYLPKWGSSPRSLPWSIPHFLERVSWEKQIRSMWMLPNIADWADISIRGIPIQFFHFRYNTDIATRSTVRYNIRFDTCFYYVKVWNVEEIWSSETIQIKNNSPQTLVWENMTHLFQPFGLHTFNSKNIFDFGCWSV